MSQTCRRPVKQNQQASYLVCAPFAFPTFLTHNVPVPIYSPHASSVSESLTSKSRLEIDAQDDGRTHRCSSLRLLPCLQVGRRAVCSLGSVKVAVAPQLKAYLSSPFTSSRPTHVVLCSLNYLYNHLIGYQYTRTRQKLQGEYSLSYQSVHISFCLHGLAELLDLAGVPAGRLWRVRKRLLRTGRL